MIPLGAGHRLPRHCSARPHSDHSDRGEHAGRGFERDLVGGEQSQEIALAQHFADYHYGPALDRRRRKRVPREQRLPMPAQRGSRLTDDPRKSGEPGERRRVRAGERMPGAGNHHQPVDQQGQLAGATRRVFAQRATGRRRGWRAFGASFLILFTAEWGDLSQLLTISLVFTGK